MPTPGPAIPCWLPLYPNVSPPAALTGLPSILQVARASTRHRPQLEYSQEEPAWLPGWIRNLSVPPFLASGELVLASQRRQQEKRSS